MKNFTLIVMFCLLAATARADGDFISGFDDLPLMPGMTEFPGELMAFVGPTGRIVENTVQGNMDRQAVLEFYTETLPQLGWVRSGLGLFTREDEILKLEFLPPRNISGSASTLMARFTLRPAEK